MNPTSTVRALALFVAVAAAATTTLSHAATPVAVWDGDFSDGALTQNGYVLSLNGNVRSQDKSIVTIGSNLGMLVNFPSGIGLNTGVTVLFKYSNLDLTAQSALVTFLCTGYNDNRTGAMIQEGGEGYGIWGGDSSATPTAYAGNGTRNTMTSEQTSGVFVFTYKYDGGGTMFYRFNGESLETIYTAGNLRSDKGAINGLAIGGMRGTATFAAATGLQISGIAIFTGALTESEIRAYIWPSEIQTINITSNTSISDINALFDSSIYKVADVVVSDGVTITADDAFNPTIRSVSSAGSITLSANSQPDASYFSGVDFSGVQGALLRTWLTPGVLGVNFVKGWGNDTSDERVESDTWVETTGANGSQTLFDGLTKITWSAAGTYSYQRYSETEDDENSPFFHGYLDDGGTGVNISVTDVPYATYDVVIYASTDTSNVKFRAKTVNNVAYTVVAGETTPGDADWGSSRLETTSYGVNAMRVKNLSGILTISGGTNNGNRGGIAAIQIMPTTAADKAEPEYELSLDGTDVNWSAGDWELGGSAVSAPLSGNARITFSASTTLTVDGTVALNKLVLDGADDAVLTIVLGNEASFVARGSVAIEGGVLKQGSASVLGATSSVIVEDGGTLDLNGLSMNAATSVYIAGDGAGNWPWALTSSSGAFSGTIQNLYLTGDATVGGANQIVLGADWSGSYGYLGGYVLTKTGAGELYVKNFNTPQTGSIIVSEGTLTTAQWNCLDKAGGTTTLTIMDGTTFIGSNQQANPPAVSVFNWDGTLNTATRNFIVKNTLNGGGTTASLNFEAGATANLKRDLTVTTALTLSGAMSFLKDSEAESDVVVEVQGALTASGAISVGAGVTLNLGTNRPTGAITVAEGGTLAAQLQNATEIITLSVSSQPSSVILYGTDGIEIANPRISYSDGTLTIKPPVPTLLASGTTDFDTAANWVNSTKPEAYGSVIIELSGDADIRLSGDYVFGDVTISGNGQVAFTSTSESTFDTDNIYLKNGARLLKTASPAVTATEINLDSGTVLKLSGTITESAAISGAGAVETYGRVDLAHANTMTGGITVKPGSSLSASVAGAYGEYQSGWSYTQQSQVVVEDGGTVDINNIANKDGAVALTIAGKGVVADGVYAGAVKYSGENPITSGSRQISSLVLTGDAMVDVGAGWGLVHSGWGNARLGLNGHTLTVRGSGTFPIVNVNTANGAATTGALVLEGATLELSRSASNLSGVNITAKGCASINLATAPSALGSLTIAPTASGTTASAWSLPANLTPVLSLSNVSASGLSDGALLPLFTAPQDTTLSADNITVVDDRTSTRFTTEISGNTIVATFHAGLPANFIHYDFNAANSIAADSTYNVGNLNPEFKHGKNGTAGWFKSGATPYWGNNTGRVSPFHSGQMTVTSVIKLKEANNTILWNFGSAFGAGIALIAKDSSTVALVSWTDGADGSDVVAVTGIPYLLNKWHLITVVADANGTTLYVDDKKASVGTVLTSGIGTQGQLGSIHGSAKNYRSVADGFLLDDWRVYDTTLTEEEIEAMRAVFFPYATMFLLR